MKNIEINYLFPFKILNLIEIIQLDILCVAKSTVSATGDCGIAPKISEVILRPIPPSHPWLVRSIWHVTVFFPLLNCGCKSATVHVVVARMHPWPGTYIRQSTSWPASSALVSTDDPSCATLAQKRITPSGDTAIQLGTCRTRNNTTCAFV